MASVSRRCLRYRKQARLGELGCRCNGNELGWRKGEEKKEKGKGDGGMRG